MKKILLSIILSLGMISSDIIYFKYTCVTDEKWPSFLGFPFVQSTDTTWVFSMSGILYLKGLFGNIIIWSIFFYLLLFIIYKITKGKFVLAKNILAFLTVCYSLFFTLFFFYAIDWSLGWDHDNFKMDYYQTNLECTRTLHILD